MEIRNPVSFHGFMIANGFGGVHPTISQLGGCIREYEKLCATCGNETAERDQKYKECCSIYIAAVHAVFPGHSRAIMSKLPGDNSLAIYMDGKHIRTVTR